MTYQPHLATAAAAHWGDLADELDRWADAGRVAALWWRDDDAVAPTPQLASLLRLASDVPIGLAVIPALAETELPEMLRETPRVAVLQHGWRHLNHAVAGKKSEFPASRSATEIAADLAAGTQQLRVLFGSQFLPMLVPPWNRFAAEFLPLLAPAGIAGLSTMAGQPGAPPSGILRADVHVDLVAWKAGRRFVGAEAALSILVGNLRDRRADHADPTRATGILTHHLVMDGAAAAFLEQVIAAVDAHPAARWTAVAELIAPQ